MLFTPYAFLHLRDDWSQWKRTSPTRDLLLGDLETDLKFGDKGAKPGIQWGILPFKSSDTLCSVLFPFLSYPLWLTSPLPLNAWALGYTPRCEIERDMQGDTIIWDWLSGTNKGLKQVTAVVHLLLGNFTGCQEAKKSVSKIVKNLSKHSILHIMFLATLIHSTGIMMQTQCVAL